MSLYRFIKLLLQNYWLVILVPLCLAILVYIQTMDEPKIYSSHTHIYTGIASGYDVNMRQGIGDRFMVQSVFENILTIMKSKETKEEVALMLLTQHLLQDSADYRIISETSLKELDNLIPEEIQKKVIVNNNFEQTFQKLQTYYKKDHSNKIYKVIHARNNHYCFARLNELAFRREKSSDIVKISFKSTDPGICVNTLKFFSEAFIRKYRHIKVSETSDIVAYFEEQLRKAQAKLDGLEDNLLSYRSSNNILDYTEQARAIAQRRQEMEGMIYEERMRMNSAQKTATYAQDQLDIHFKILSKNTAILKKRHKLENMASQLAMYRTFSTSNSDSISVLEKEMQTLRTEMEKDLSDIFAVNYTTSGVKTKEILKKWFENIIEVGESKARLEIYDERSENFKKLYSTMAPVGSNLTKIEREVGVAESEYLRILEALNLAKLRQQNIALSTRLKVVDPPKFPTSSDPSKRKLLIIIAVLLGGALIVGILVLLEFLDKSIRQPMRLMKLTGLKLASAYPLFPKKRKNKKIYYDQLQQTLTLRLIRNLKQQVKDTKSTKYIAISSMLSIEGKSFVAQQLAEQLVAIGLKVKVFQPNDSAESHEHAHYYDPTTILMTAQSHLDLIGDIEISNLDYILIEYPHFHSHQTPYPLLKTADATILVTRSSRSWTIADKEALENIKEIAPVPPLMFLNGVKPNFLEEIIGELPKKRSKIRKYIRRLLHLEFK